MRIRLNGINSKRKRLADGSWNWRLDVAFPNAQQRIEPVLQGGHAGTSRFSFRCHNF